MDILDGVVADDLFLYLPEHKTFILSDIHIGYEESLNRQGVLVPKNSYTDLMIRLERSLESIMKKNAIDKIVINGDLIHEFGKVSRKEKDLTKKFIKFLSGYGEVTLVEGNHDKALKYILGEDVKIVENVILGQFLIIHGDRVPLNGILKGVETIIIGHEHPSISLTSGSRVERFKCFLKGDYERKKIIVMPSCNLFLEGTDVSREKLLSPLLKKSNILDFEAFIIEDKIYDFGKIKGLLK